MWGIIPAAGSGTRIQPLACSKELLPVGCRVEGTVERPKAVSEYLVERMILGGADKLCFVISPGKSDILEYYTRRYDSIHLAYVVQPRPAGLCDALFRAGPIVKSDEPVLIGLPDTIWFPEDGFRALADDALSFLLFPVDHPEFFDAVLSDEDGRVREIQVKRSDAESSWIWGAFKMPGATFQSLFQLWCERQRQDEYVGTLINAYLSRGGVAFGVRAGNSYVDVGTVAGYRRAIQLLTERPQGEAIPSEAMPPQQGLPASDSEPAPDSAAARENAGVASHSN
jgi:glucose-1-phosphate thymidylyltransferase